MLEKKAYTYTVLISIGIIVCFLFAIKDSVSRLNTEIKMVDCAINYERNNIKTLTAELTYLRSPQRLQLLVDRFAKLDSVKITQMMDDPLLSGNFGSVNSANSDTKTLLADNAKNYHKSERIKDHTKKITMNVKWRYKRPLTRTIQKASHKNNLPNARR